MFREQLPYYLSIGVTWEQYWDGEPDIPMYYRKAFEISKQRENQKMWLQGCYVYEALADISVAFRDFAPKGAKVQRYPAEPYPITRKDVDERREEVERNRFEKQKALVAQWSARVNAAKSKQRGDAHA